MLSRLHTPSHKNENLTSLSRNERISLASLASHAHPISHHRVKNNPFGPGRFTNIHTDTTPFTFMSMILVGQVYRNEINHKTIDYSAIKYISRTVQNFICVSRNTWSLSLMNSWENRINDFGFRKQLISRRKPGYCWWGCDLKMLFLSVSIKPNEPRKCKTTQSLKWVSFLWYIFCCDHTNLR